MRRLLLSMLAATAVFATACGGDSSTGPVNVVGTYSLQTVNSKPLPYLAYDDGTEKIEVISDSYTLAGNGTYTNQTVVRTTVSGTPTTDTYNYDGTYTQSGSSVTLTDSQDPTDQVTGTISGSTFTINVQGLALVYTRS